jgi:hypothetical protein
MDRLVALAEVMGGMNIENPEQGRWGENFYVLPDEVVARIEAFLGMDITPPEIAGGRYGLKTKKGLFAYRDINSIYVAWRIKELLGNKPDPRVCELGAGMGKVAYYCHRIGLRHYTIIDLPQINAIQAFYLLRSLPKVRVGLLG